MKKIKILKAFNTTHDGYLSVNDEPTVSDSFADYCVNKLKAAVFVEVAKPIKNKDKNKNKRVKK